MRLHALIVLLLAGTLRALPAGAAADPAAAAAANVSTASAEPAPAKGDQLSSLAKKCGRLVFPANCDVACSIRNCLVCKAGSCLCCDRGFVPSANGRACDACPFPFTTTRPGSYKCNGEAGG